MTKTTHARAPRQPRKPRPKPLRFARIVNDAETLTCNLIIRQIAQPGGRETVDTYTLENIGTDTPGARGLSLTKQDGTVYNIELDGGSRTCDCPAGTRFGCCKHADSLAALIATGRL
jgi:hypothetical protein